MVTDLSIAAVLVAALFGLTLATIVGSIASRLGFPMPDERRRLGTIDGLRGYLALLVMVHHFATYLLLASRGGVWRDAPATILKSFGAGSVTLFFMITGALFFPKTWRGFRGNNWRTMYISRIFRILPMQAATVAIIALVALTRVETSTPVMWLSVPARIALWLTSYWQPRFFGYDDSAQISAFVMWSLLAEWKFYLVALPVISIFMGLAGLKLGRWLIPVILIMTGTAFHYSSIAILMTFNYAMFGCGMVALLVRLGPAASFFCRGPITPVGIAAVVASAALSSVPDDLLPLIGYTIFFACVVCGNRFGGLLTTRGALVLGEASFSIYLLHGVLLNIAFVSGSRWVGLVEPTSRPWLLVPLMPAMAAIAIASYLLIERPMIAYGRRIARRWRSPAMTAADNSSVVAAP